MLKSNSDQTQPTDNTHLPVSAIAQTSGAAIHQSATASDTSVCSMSSSSSSVSVSLNIHSGEASIPSYAASSACSSSSLSQGESDDIWAKRYARDWGVLPAVTNTVKDEYVKRMNRFFYVRRKFDLSWLQSRCLQDSPQPLPLSTEQQDALIKYLLIAANENVYKADTTEEHRLYNMANDFIQLCRLVCHYVSSKDRETLYKTLSNKTNLNASAWSMLLGLPLDVAQINADIAHDAKRQLPFEYHLGHWALATGHESGLGYFFSHALTQENLNQQTDLGESMLHIAAKYGHVACVKVLLHAGAKYDTVSYPGCTALQLAAQAGHASCIEVLLKHEIDANAAGPTDYSALYSAAMYGHANCIDALLQAGVNPNAMRKGDSTPLHFAAQFGYVACVVVLLNAGAKYDLVDQRGYTALHWAAQEGHTACVEVLLKHEMAANTAGPKDYRALHLAAQEGHTLCLEVILKLGIDPNISRLDGFTALHFAAQSGHEDCITALLDAGANIDAVDEYGYTALRMAAATGRLASVEILLMRGATLFLSWESHHWGDVKKTASTLLAAGVAVINASEIHPTVQAHLRKMTKLVNDSDVWLGAANVSLLGILLDGGAGRYSRIMSVAKSWGYSRTVRFSQLHHSHEHMHFTLPSSCPPYIDLWGHNQLNLALQGNADAIAFLVTMPEPKRTIFFMSLRYLVDELLPWHKPSKYAVRNLIEAFEKKMEENRVTEARPVVVAAPQGLGRAALFDHRSNTSSAASSSASAVSSSSSSSDEDTELMSGCLIL